MKAILQFTDSPAAALAHPREELEAELVHPGVAELKQHSTFAPLAIGDLVEIRSSGLVVGIKHLEPVYVVEATLHLPRGTMFGHAPTDEHPAMRAVNECYEDWRRAAPVTRATAFTFLVSSQSRGWLEENIEDHPYVEHVDWVRDPQTRPALDYWLAHPNF